MDALIYMKEVLQKNSKKTYLLFFMLISTTIGIVAAAFVRNLMNNCRNFDSAMNFLGIAGGIGTVFILSTEIVSYEKILVKIKKAIGH
ncbi:MAG: hypothetical protein WA063_06315 [Minisyncoccia bacterium]